MKILIALFTFVTLRLGAALAPSAAVVHAAEDFSKVAELADPWMVNISSTQIVHQQLTFWGYNAGEYRRQSLGSGIILSADGRIVTNAHVISGADEIKVRLVGGEEYTATVLGEDENVDLAVIQIHPKSPLNPALLGDSSSVKVGEWAIAIGNPFGFDHSVTVGVISAKARGNVLGDQGRGKYQNFLQTDASINHGNSGGPLCNIQGEVIGINTVISTPNEGSIGIGFAIPINMVKRAIPDLIKSGHVITPRLGFYTQDIDEAMASALKLTGKNGVLVKDVVAGQAADKAGLKRLDVIDSINGVSIHDGADFKTRLFEVKPGEAIALGLLRKGLRLNLSLQTQIPNAGESTGWRGIEVEENSLEKARNMGLAIARGLIISKVSKGSSAEKIGLNPGDLIVEVNRQRMDTRAIWSKLTEQIEDDSDAIILIVRGQQSAYVVLPAEE